MKSTHPFFSDLWDADLRSVNPFTFPGETDALNDSTEESVRTGLSCIGGKPIVMIEMRLESFGGTMGLVAGEKISKPLIEQQSFVSR